MVFCRSPPDRGERKDRIDDSINIGIKTTYKIRAGQVRCLCVVNLKFKLSNKVKKRSWVLVT